MSTKLLFPHLQSMRIENVFLAGNTVTMTVAATGATALCPLCQRGSVRVHSRYQRTVADLLMSRGRGPCPTFPVPHLLLPAPYLRRASAIARRAACPQEPRPTSSVGVDRIDSR